MLDKDIADLIGSPPPLPTLTPANLALLRAGMAQAGRALPAPDIATVRDFSANGIPVRLYRPDDVEKPPLLVFLHGGGWMLGDLDSHDAIPRILADRARCAVLSVGYRLAPEHPFPAALNDVEAAWLWIKDNAAELGCDAQRMALSGESAGGNLAAALTLRCRAAAREQPMFQLLVHPATDLHFELPRFDEIAVPGLDRAYLQQCAAMYANGVDLADPLISPLLAGHHHGLPPAIVLTAAEDPLREEGERYADALVAAGVETHCQRLAGLPHGFMFLPVTIPAVSRAFDIVAELLQRSFAAR